MDVLYERCCGLDVHKRSVTACRLMPGRGRAAEQGDAHLRHDDGGLCWPWATGWRHGGVTHVAMESDRGLLEAGLEPARGAVHACCWSTPPTSRWCPGASATSGTPSGWPTCCAMGCCAPSFVPDRPARELRELTRYRSSLGPRAHRRGQPAAEDAGGGQHQAGQRGQRRDRGLGAGDAGELVAGHEDAAALAELARGAVAAQAGRLGAGPDRPHERPPALHGRPSTWPTSTRWTSRSPPWARRSRSGCALLSRNWPSSTRSPASGRWSAEVILAEIGTDMSRFPDRGASGQLGGDVSGARRERRQAPLAARRAKAAPGCG